MQHLSWTGKKVPPTDVDYMGFGERAIEDRLRRFVIPLIASTLLLSGAMCQSSDEDEESDEPAAKAESSSESDSSNASGETPGEDLYPGMNFSELTGEQRTLFVDIAKAELCPCEKSSESLHACLQEKSTQCASAKQLGSLVADGIRGGLEKEGVQDQIAEKRKSLTKNYEFELANSPRNGPKDAPVVIVEFADFQCPHCKRAAKALKQVREKYGDKVVHYFKHYPLDPHRQADLAARASIAAHQQGEFWPMHDLLFEHQRSLSRKKIVSFARQLGLSISKFESALKAPSVVSQVKADKQEAKDADIQGTPAIFVNGRKHMGPNTARAISQSVERALESADGDADESNSSDETDAVETDAGDGE